MTNELGYVMYIRNTVKLYISSDGVQEKKNKKKKKTCKDGTSFLGIFKQWMNAYQTEQKCLAQGKC